MKWASRAQWAIALAALPAVLWVSFEALRSAAADSIVESANATLMSPAWTRSGPDLESLLVVRRELLRAQALAPESPAVLESLGVLHSRRATNADFVLYARDYFERSLGLRPVSPYTWANLAQALYLLGQIGPELETALVRATFYGPWEPEVQHVVADVGLAIWSEANPATRAAVARMLDFGMRRNPLEFLQISQRRGRLDLACAHVEGNPRVQDPKWLPLCREKSRP